MCEFSKSARLNSKRARQSWFCATVGDDPPIAKFEVEVVDFRMCEYA